VKAEGILPYPKEEYAILLKNFYGSINGMDSFDSVRHWEKEKWSATVNCSRGKVLQKAGFAQMCLKGGVINNSPADLMFLETIAYPSNPRIPGFIMMTNMNETEAMGRIIVFYCDLMLQGDGSFAEEKNLFSAALRTCCEQHGHDYEEHRAMITGRGFLGGSGGECGFLNFFQESAIPFLEAVMKGVLAVYRDIIKKNQGAVPDKADYIKMHRSRARLIEWIILEDYGIQVARENGILSEVIEAYAFPPVIRY
jgi:coproporphyrinogen III oxidase